MTDWVVEVTCGTIQQRSSSTFPAGCSCKQFWHGQERSLFDVVHPPFPVPTMAPPTLQSTLKGGFGEAVLACDMPKHNASFRLLKVARKGSCGLTRKLTLLSTQSSVLRSTWEMRRRFLMLLVSNRSFLQSQQAGSMFHSRRGGWT